MNRKIVYCHEMATSGEMTADDHWHRLGPEDQRQDAGAGRLREDVRAVARRAKDVNLKILASRSVRQAGGDRGARRRAGLLERLLQEADFVSAHAPLSKATHHIGNEAPVRRDEADGALQSTPGAARSWTRRADRALREGKLAGAGLDVLEKEPPGPEEPAPLDAERDRDAARGGPVQRVGGGAAGIRHGEEIAQGADR